jgi:hypothetical protein
MVEMNCHREEGGQMSYRVMCTVLFLLFLGVLTPQFAQNTTASLEKADQVKRRQLAVGLLRTINTAEASEFATYGVYGSWQTLLLHHSEYFSKHLTMSYPQERVDFATPPGILPGWNLRLNVHGDGKGYDLLLRDTTDEKCGYAAVTDEEGVIRQSKAIDCEI